MKKLFILGAGESGIGAALLGREVGYDVFVSDSGKIKSSFKEELIAENIPFEENTHSLAKLLVSNVLIKSPGISPNISIIKEAEKKGIKVISEIEFAAQFTKAYKICVSGTNGKTTSSTMIYEIMKNARLDVCLAGNIGVSFARCLAKRDYEYFVLELSSFQLDYMFDFKADISVLTNIIPDHLDRYNQSLEIYINSKFRICRNQTPQDFFIYNADDENISKYLPDNSISSTMIPFSIKKEISGNAAWISEKTIEINIKNNIMTMMIENLALQGKHNLYNSMAAAVAARVLEIKKDSIKESLADFQNIEHRLEFVTKVHGISFINDSKATNVNSTWYALESMNRPVIWIAGGTDKGNDYKDLIPLVKNKVKSMICLGLDNSRLIEVFGSVVPEIHETNSMKTAVESAYYMGNPGDIILLSPACASFDLFENFEDRGTKFKFAIREL